MQPSCPQAVKLMVERLGVGNGGINLGRKPIMTLENELSVVTAENLNLDCSINPDWLWAFWNRTNSVRPISFARQLFPNVPKGYVRATKDLGNYAANKATA